MASGSWGPARGGWFSHSSWAKAFEEYILHSRPSAELLLTEPSPQERSALPDLDQQDLSVREPGE